VYKSLIANIETVGETLWPCAMPHTLAVASHGTLSTSLQSSNQKIDTGKGLASILETTMLLDYVRALLNQSGCAISVILHFIMPQAQITNQQKARGQGKAKVKMD
jgi:hypothetical protein